MSSLSPSRRDFLKITCGTAGIPLIGTTLITASNQPIQSASLKGSAKSVVIPTHEFFGNLDERLDFPAEWKINAMNMKGYGAPVGA
jgi:hypothetical protein